MGNDEILEAVLERLGKKYEYLEPLGRGGFSKVYLVRHRVFNEKHALKIMDWEYFQNILKKGYPDDWKNEFSKSVKRFIYEARLYRKINVPNVVKIHDVDVVSVKGESVKFPYLLMKYIRGTSLAKVLKENGPLELQQALNIARDVLNAIKAIHEQSIIHRDIKPGNIMIVEESGKGIIIDFGLAKDMLNRTGLTTSGVGMGTPSYMSPEQFKGLKDVRCATDIYSFGVVLYEMVTGEVPFVGKMPIELMLAHQGNPVPDVTKRNPDLPIEIDGIIRKAMAKEIGDRYQSAEEVMLDINKLEEIF